MSDQEKQIACDEQGLLDRLVDGELDAVEQRQLLLLLESMPDGWRRCALAFLEAQAWEHECKSFCWDAPAASKVPPSVSLPAQSAPASRAPARHKTGWGGRIASALGIAASFLIAFGLGLVWRAWDGVDRPGPTGGLASAPRPMEPNALPSVGQSESHSRRMTDDLQWATVSLPVTTPSGDIEQFEMPVAMGPGVDMQWLVDRPSSLPLHLVRDLERQGHQVRQARQFIPFQLQDGRQVVMPVEQIEVRFMQDQFIP